MVIRSPRGRAISPGLRSHRLAGVVHIIEVIGSVDDMVDAIRRELDGCGVRALVVDMPVEGPMDPSAATRILAELDTPRLDGHWQIRLGAETVTGHALRTTAV